MKVFALTIIIALVSCTKQDQLGPEAALKDFVQARSGEVIDRDFIIKRVTGKLLQNFQQMSKEEFAQFADMSHIKTDKFEVVSKSCEEKKCFLTYVVGYQSQKNEKTQTISEVKKIAEMVQVESKWLIAEVSNIKTYHENLEPISLRE